MKLFTYFRSSAAFRVRIGLNLKNIPYESIPINLKPGEDEQFSSDYRALNAQARVPFLIDGAVHLSQSTAILEYIDEQYTTAPLLPSSIVDRAQVRRMVNLIACDIHPLNNLSVLNKLKDDYGAEQTQCDDWYRHWIVTGFEAYEALLQDFGGAYSFGDSITLADVYLVPQVWNAIRFNANLESFPRIREVYERCISLETIREAMPEHQPDNPNS